MEKERKEIWNKEEKTKRRRAQKEGERERERERESPFRYGIRLTVEQKGEREKRKKDEKTKVVYYRAEEEQNRSAIERLKREISFSFGLFFAAHHESLPKLFFRVRSIAVSLTIFFL